MSNETFIRNLRTLRKLKLVTRERMVEELNCLSVSSIKRYEEGKSMPNSCELEALCSYFHVDADQLLGIKTRTTNVLTSKRAQAKLKSLYELEIEIKENPDALYYIFNNTNENRKYASYWTPEGRVPRPVNGQNVIQAAEFYGEISGVIRNKEEFEYFIICGGTAIIEKELAKNLCPRWLDPVVDEDEAFES